MNIFYTYVYLNPLKRGKYTYADLDICFLYEPFYIGKGKNKRIDSHLTASCNQHCFNTIKKIQKEYGDNPFRIKIIKNVSETGAFAYERKAIIAIGREDDKTGTLTNHNNGGFGAEMSPTTIEKIRKGVHRHNETHGLSEGQKVRYAELSEIMEGNQYAKNAGIWKGDKNPSRNRDNNGPANTHAKNAYVILSPNDDIYFIPAGCINRFARDKHLGVESLKDSAKRMKATGSLYRIGSALPQNARGSKGWATIPLQLSDNPKNDTMGNQQPSSLLVIAGLLKRSGSTTSRKAYTQVSGNGVHPSQVIGRMKIWSELWGDLEQKLLFRLWNNDPQRTYID